MARLDHTFTMSEAPDRAQSLFQEQVGPALRRGGGFRLLWHQPGRLVYVDSPSESWGRSSGRDGGLFGPLRRLTARRLQVEFAPDGNGTSVHIHGSMIRVMRDELHQLGAPGRWPQQQPAGDAG